MEAGTIEPHIRIAVQELTLQRSKIVALSPSARISPKALDII
ncbi:hypothetical protein TRIP_C90405 [Candidatus Zixiibacteriota bacterium]|nr:hypothetical protein TRIP_C90405 [candidate division Zixibacteria bacterium]